MLFVEGIDPNLAEFIETHLWEALLAVPIHEPDFGAFKAALLDAQATFRAVVYETDRFKVPGLMHMVGHSHLDIVYQWPHREYIRKIGRTHATMLQLMEQYPGFKFSQSSAKIYADMKTHFPDVFEQVKQRIAEGRWQPVGAFWLEPDANLISGESFVRHILHGQRFWQAEFGFRSRVCWLIDVFGMSWALPQILQRSGIDVVISNKFFVWNDTNPWRTNTFWWEGADGSRVLGVVPPGHFIGMVDPDHMMRYWGDYRDKQSIGEVIYTYGWGDGGGGVTPEMLECADRYANFPGLVPTQYANPEDALLSIAERAQHTDLPVWKDEMYLEAHRGTFTSKGRLKKLNRQSEVLLRDAEMLASFAWRNGADYPAQHLDDAWKLLLGTQFHDALPGTHITEVYTDLLDEYAQLARTARQVIDEAGQSLAGDGDGNAVWVFNSLLAARGGVIQLPAEGVGSQTLAMSGGTPLVRQAVRALDSTEYVLVDVGDTEIPGVGYRVFPLVDLPPSLKVEGGSLRVTATTLENEFLRAEFAPDGELISMWDKDAEREVIRQGERGNRFQIYEDYPGRYDAWDIISSYPEQELPMRGEATLTVDETGPLRVSLKLVRPCYDSTITQRISLTQGSPILTFETEIDWHERQRLLKVGFPVAVNTRTATYDIAYGNIERVTHRNTSFDAARFEVPAYRWMDMSEAGYGVALLNDSKYGHEANGPWMRLTLLKGSISPDPHADREVHHFIYGLYPHMGDWRTGGVITAADALNTPLHVRRTAAAPTTYGYLTCDAPNVTLEAVKQAEDGQAVIIRLVERHNMLTRATLTLDHEPQSAHYCDLMEAPERDVFIGGRTLHVELRPHEIITLAIAFPADYV